VAGAERAPRELRVVVSSAVGREPLDEIRELAERNEEPGGEDSGK